MSFKSLLKLVKQIRQSSFKQHLSSFIYLFIYLIIEVQRIYFCGNIKFNLYIRSWLDKEEFLEQGNAFSDANI